MSLYLIRIERKPQNSNINLTLKVIGVFHSFIKASIFRLLESVCLNLQETSLYFLKHSQETGSNLRGSICHAMIFFKISSYHFLGLKKKYFKATKSLDLKEILSQA